MNIYFVYFVKMEFINWYCKIVYAVFLFLENAEMLAKVETAGNYVVQASSVV